LYKLIFNSLFEGGVIISDFDENWLRLFKDEVRNIKTTEIINFEEKNKINFGYKEVLLLQKKSTDKESDKDIYLLKSQLEKNGFRNIKVLEKRERYLYETTDYKITFVIKADFGSESNLYFVKTRRVFAKENEDLASEVLYALNLPSPETKVYGDYFVSKFIGDIDASEIKKEQLLNAEFRKRLANELGKTAYVIYILGLADRSLENIRVKFDERGLPNYLINVELTTAFFKLYERDFSEELIILSQLMRLARIFGLRNEEIKEIIEEFIRGFEEQSKQTKNFYLENEKDIDNKLSNIKEFKEIKERILAEDVVKEFRNILGNRILGYFSISLGENLENLVAKILGVTIGLPLIEKLQELSITLQQALIKYGHQGEKNEWLLSEEEKQKYKNLLDLIPQLFGRIPQFAVFKFADIEITKNPAVIQEDAYSFATIKVYEV